MKKNLAFFLLLGSVSSSLISKSNNSDSQVKKLKQAAENFITFKDVLSRSDLKNVDFLSEELVEFLRLFSPKNNFFELDGRTYQVKKGTHQGGTLHSGSDAPKNKITSVYPHPEGFVGGSVYYVCKHKCEPSSSGLSSSKSRSSR